MVVEAQALAYAIEIGAASSADARDWADLQISKLTAPTDELLSLAVEHNTAEVISLLHRLGNDAPRQAVGAAVYSWLLRGVVSGALSHRRAADAVARLTRESCAPSQDAEAESWHFDDAFYLADKKIYGTAAEVALELEQHLKRYSAQ